MPKDEKSGVINFGDQALEVNSDNPPSETTDKTEKPVEERVTALAEGLGIDLPKDGDA